VGLKEAGEHVLVEPAFTGEGASAAFRTAPNVEIDKNGGIIVTEVIHEGVRELEVCVREVSSTSVVNSPININKVHTGILCKLQNVVQPQLRYH